MMTTKKCNGCQEVKPLSEFSERLKGGRKYPRSRCKACNNKRRSERGYTQRCEEMKRRRQDPEHRAYFIHVDSKSSDKKHGREFGLTIELIDELLKNPCSYCGDTEIQRTLDRIDNSVGHVSSNVVAACLRCNFIRGSMPYEAWISICDAVKATAEAGLFGDWGSSPLRRR